MPIDLGQFKKKKVVQEDKKIEISQKKIALEPEKKIDSLIEQKKLKIGSEIDIDLKLLTKPLKRITEFDIPNAHISQDDLWTLHKLIFGKGTRTKRHILLPKFTEAFKKNLAKLKK